MKSRKNEAHRRGSDGRGGNKRGGATRFCLYCTGKTRLAQVGYKLTFWLSQRIQDAGEALAWAGDWLAGRALRIECQRSVWSKQGGAQ